MNRFKAACMSGDFVVTAEIGPPKGTDISAMVADIELLKDRVAALNVTDNQSAVMRMGPLSAAHQVIERGGEAVYQLTCRDRNRLALQSDLLSAHVLGVRNLLCLTGDHPCIGDHPQAKPVYDFDSVTSSSVRRGSTRSPIGTVPAWRAPPISSSGLWWRRTQMPLGRCSSWPRKWKRRRVFPDPGRVLRHAAFRRFHDRRPQSDGRHSGYGVGGMFF